MKDINYYIKESFNIIEGLRINKNIKVNTKDELDFNQFKHEVMTLYDLSEENFQNFCDKYDNQFNLPKGSLKEYNFKLTSQNDDNNELFNYGADFINHPSRIKKYTSFDYIYINSKADLTVLYHENDELGDFLYFLDYTHDSYDIYQLIK